MAGPTLPKVQTTTTVTDGTDSLAISTAGADAVSNTGNRADVSSHQSAFNGVSWDRVRAGIVTPTATLTGWQNILAGGVYRVTPTALTDLQGGPVALSSRSAVQTNADTLQFFEDSSNGVAATAEKPLAVSTYTPDRDSSAAAETNSVTKSSAGVLYEADISNSSGAIRYWQMHNTASLPADGVVPVISIAVPAAGSVQRSWPKGIYFSTGMTWCWSTTQATKTIGGSDGIATIGYK